MSAPRRRRLGQRDELLILLPVTLLTLVVLSTFTLFAYRSTLELALEERRLEAERLARHVSARVASLPATDAEELARLAPTAIAVSLLDSEGAPVARSGEPLVTAGQPAPATVAGSARLRSGGRDYTVEVHLPAVLLRSRERSAEVLTWVVLGFNGGASLLVLFFLHRLLAPFDRLLARARDLRREDDPARAPAGDDVELLVETFESALEALSRPREVDDLLALERTLARSLESGVLLCDRGGAVLALNEVGAGLLGLEVPSPGEPLGRLLAPLPRLRAVLEGAIERGGGVQREECAIETAEGERTLGLTVHPLRRDDARVRGFLVLFADLTAARAEAEQERLAASLAQLGELAGGVAHELRNSLATLRGYLTLIERDPERDSLADYLHEIRHESDHLQRVLEDFLSFARPGSVRLEPVELLGLLHRAAADPAIEGARFRITSEPAAGAEELVVPGDPQLLERALRNLLHNAAQAQLAGGREEPVEVGLKVAGGEVELVVADRGPGLPEGLSERLFDPFVSQRPGGVGLGLALARRIFLLHGGRLTLENRAAGGARAVVRWTPGKIDTKRNAAPLPERPSPGRDG